MPKIQIGNRRIQKGMPAYIIAEMSANHGGSKERAKEIIHRAKESGADCVKIQTYTADTITMNCHNQYFQIKDGTWEGDNLYSLYQKAYTPWEWQKELKAEADKIGIDFLSTPFDMSAVDFLEELEVNCYKIASFELIDLPLISYVASKQKPIIMSTGMGTLSEIEDAVNTILAQGNNKIALLKCASAYPAISDEMNLATMANMAKTFHVVTGLSDHSMGSVAAATAVALGGSIIEKHFCLDRKIENPDASFSMEPQEFADMVRDVRAAECAIGSVSYGATAQEQKNLKFRKSIFVSKDVKKGECITEQNIRVIRPGYGMLPKYYHTVLGQRALVDMERGTPLRPEYIGQTK
ncbi:MAG: pseudaminic acid synthase [Lachnospiraceae bacterium]